MSAVPARRYTARSLQELLEVLDRFRDQPPAGQVPAIDADAGGAQD
jgi:hypothetical protein